MSATSSHAPKLAGAHAAPAGPRATYAPSGLVADDVRIIPKKRKARPENIRLTKKTGAGRRDTDITLDPAIVRALKQGILVLNMDQSTLISSALQRFFAFLQIHPQAVQKLPGVCPTCKRQFKHKRPSRGMRRVRLSVCLTVQDIAAVEWIADEYYHGTFSRALEAAIIHFLPEHLLPPDVKLLQR